MPRWNNAALVMGGALLLACLPGPAAASPGVQAAPAPALVAPAAVATLGLAPAARARASVTASYTINARAKVVLVVRSNARKVTVKYRTSTNRKKTKVIKMRGGARTLVLPRGAKSITVKARATSKLRASRRLAAVAVPTVATPAPSAPAPAPTPAPTTPPAIPGAGKFQFLVIPDTQQEVDGGPDVFDARMGWIAANAQSQGIKFLVQVGDLVNSDNCGRGSIVYLDVERKRWQCNEAMRAASVFWPNPYEPDHFQYKNADRGLDLIEAARIPISVAVGNHDTQAVCGGDACVGKNPDWAVPAGTSTYDLARNTRTWNAFFPPSRFSANSRKGTFESGKSDNMYQVVRAGGVDWLLLNIELWPRPEAVAWARGVVGAYPKANVIINTHHHLSPNGALAPMHGGYGSTSPQYLLDNLIKTSPNIKLVFSGHNNGTVMRTDTGNAGNPVYSFLTAFHDDAHSQVRVVEIDTAAGTLRTFVRQDTPNLASTLPGTEVSLTGLNWVAP